MVVVTQSEPGGAAAVRRIADGFEGQVRAVETIPFDPALKSGALRFDQLRPTTQDAWLRVAAAAATTLNPESRVMNDSILGKGLAILIAAATVLAVGFGFVAETITALVCGVRPVPAQFFSGLWVAVTGDPAAYEVGAGCVLPVWQIRTADAALLLALAAVVVGVWVWWRRYRQSDRSFLTDLRLRPGFAEAAEIRTHLSAGLCSAGPGSSAPTSPARKRPMWGGGSGGRGGWTCSCPSKTPSPSKAHPGPGRGTGC